MIKRFNFTDEFDNSVRILSAARKFVAKEMLEILINILENKEAGGNRNVRIKFDRIEKHWIALSPVKMLLIFRKIDVPDSFKQWEIRANSVIKVDFLWLNDPEEFVEFTCVEYCFYDNAVNRIMTSPRYPKQISENIMVTQSKENNCESAKKQIDVNIPEGDFAGYGCEVALAGGLYISERMYAAMSSDRMS